MLQPRDALFKRFRSGNLLKISAAREVLEFKLTGTSKMLSALLRCSENNSKQGRKSTNPFVN